MDREKDFFDIVAGILQRDKFAPYLFIICQDYADDLALLANTSTQAESLLHSLEHAAGALTPMSIETATCVLNEKRDISTLIGGFLELVDKFTYLGSSVSSTENEINVRLVKAWTAIDKISIIWKSDSSDEIKHNILPSIGRVNSNIWMNHMDPDKAYRDKSRQEITRMLRAILYKSWKQHPTKQQQYSHRPPFSKTIQIKQKRHGVYCGRIKDELISDVLLWTPSHGRASVERPARTYLQLLCTDT